MAVVINGTTGIQVPNFIENEQSIDADYTIAATKNAASIGNIEISTGVTVTVTSGGNWVIL
jgi:hypothetical protein